MRKFVALTLTVMFMLLGLSTANAWVTRASAVKTATGSFGGHLSSNDNTVQKALDTLDDITAGGDVTGVGDCADGACLDGSSDGGTYIYLYDGDSNKFKIDSPNISSDYTLILPGHSVTMPVSDGSSGQFIQTNASGVWSFATAPGGGTVTSIMEDNARVGDADIIAVDFGTSFEVTESPDTEMNITLDVSPSTGNATLVVTEDSVQVKFDTTDFAETSGEGLVLGGSPTIATALLIGSDPAEAGTIRLPSAGSLVFEDTTEGAITHVAGYGFSFNVDLEAADGNNAFIIRADNETTDTLALQAMDIDGSYTSLVTLTSHTSDPTLTLASTGASTYISSGSTVTIESVVFTGAAVSGVSTLGTTDDISIVAADPDLVFTDSDHSADGRIMVDSVDAVDVVMVLAVDDGSSDDNPYIELDGANDRVEMKLAVVFDTTAEFDGIATFDANPRIYDGSHYLTFDADGLSAAATIKFGGDTNNLLIANGTATIDIAAAATLNLDKTLNVGTNAGTLNFTGASKTLSVEDNATVDQDLTTDATVQFGGIELGAATDTSILRGAAGAVTVEGDYIILSGDTITGDVGVTFDVDGSSAATIADSVAVTSWVLTTPSITNGITITGADASPNTASEFLYDNVVAGLDDGAFAYYNSDADIVYYIASYPVVPGDAEDDYVLAYDKDSDRLYFKTDESAGTTKYNAISDPDADGSISFGNDEEAVYTSAQAAAANDVFTFEATGAFADISIVKITQNTGDPTDGTLLELISNDPHVDELLIAADAAAYTIFNQTPAGGFSIDITSDGTPLLTIADEVSLTKVPAASAAMDVLTLSGTLAALDADNFTAILIDYDTTADHQTSGEIVMLEIDALDGDADVNMWGIRIGNMANQAAAELAIAVGTGWDAGLSFADDTANIAHSGATSLSIISASGTVIVEAVTFTAAAVSGVSTLAMTGALSGATTAELTHTAPTITLIDSDAAAGTANLLFASGTANDIVATIQVDEGGGAVTYLTLDGPNDQVLFGEKADLTSLGIENVGNISDDAAFTIQATGGGIGILANANDQDITLTVDDAGTDWAVTLDGSEGTVIIGSGAAFDHILKFDASNADGTITWDENPGEWDFAADINSSAAATFTVVTVNTEVYGVGWNNDNSAPTKDATYDKIEAISGDITDVGPGFASGAAFTDGVASTGTQLFVWEGTTVDTVEFIIVGPADPSTSDSTVTFREASGTVLISGDTLTGHATATFDTDGSTATTVVDFALNTDADAGDIDIKSVDGLYGVDDDIYLDMGTQGKAILAADSTVEILVSDEDITFADGGADLINVASGSGTATVDFGTINLATDAFDVSDGDISNVGVIKADELEPDAVANGSLIVQGGQTAGNTLKLQVYDVDGAAYVDIITITAVNDAGLTGGTIAIDSSDWNIDATGAITGVALDGDGTGNTITNVKNSAIKWADIDNLASEGALVVADESSDTSCNVLFVTAATGNLPAVAGTNLTFNSSTGELEATIVSVITALYPDGNDDADIGTTALGFNDLFLADGGKIQLGNDQDVVILHVADQGILMELDDYISFGDSAVYIESDADSYLDFVADGAFRFFDAANGGDPVIQFGAAAAEALVITVDVGAGDALLDKITFATATSQAGADEGKYIFDVDGTSILQIDDGGINPATNNTQTLGDSTLKWGDLFLGDGSVINFNADVTITHSTNTIAFAGATSSYTFDDAIDITSAEGLILSQDETIINSTNGRIDMDGHLALDNDSIILYFGEDQDVTLTHTADTGLSMNMSLAVADDKFISYGGSLAGYDWTAMYDETTSNRLEYTHTAGADADVYWDLNDSAADSVFTIANSDGTYEANLVVDGNITSSSSGASFLQLTNNSGGLTPSGYRIYVDNAEWYFSENGAEELILTQEDGATLTGATWSFLGVTNMVLPSAAADATGEISMSTGNQLIWHDGTKVITIDTTPTNDNYVLKYDNASATFTLEADETGGTPAWNSVTDPTADVDIEHDSGEETQFTYVGNFSTGAQFNIEQDTGNPTGGILFQVKAADTDVTLARLGDGTNYTQISQAGNLTLGGSAQITAGAIILGDTTPDTAGEIGFVTNAFKFFGANSEDLSINVGTGANACTITSNTSVDSLDIEIATLITDAITASAVITASAGLIIADAQTLTFDEAASDPADADVTFGAVDGVLTIGTANGHFNETLTVTLDGTENIVAIDAGGGSAITLVSTSGTVTVESVVFTGASITTITGVDASGTISADLFTPDAQGAGDIGSTSLEFNDLFLDDAGKIQLGDDQDVLITHVPDVGFNIKHVATADDKPIKVVYQTNETDITSAEILGGIYWQAIGEGSGTDAVAIAAGIEAVAEAEFTSSVNTTKLSFKTGASEAATEKMALSSAGVLTTVSNIELGHASANTLSASSGVLSIEGNVVHHTGGTDVADGDINDDLTITSTKKISTTLTSEQLRLNYDATNYATWTVDATGATTVTTVDADGAVAHLTFSPNGTIILTPATDVVGALTADSVASDGVVSGTTITASTGFGLGDADWIGISGNEIITFNAAGTIVASGGILKADGGLAALTPVTGATEGFAAGFTGANLYGGTYIANSDGGDLTIPSIAVGMNFTIITLGAIQIVVEPSDTDNMILDGTALDNNDSATNLTAAGDIIVFQYYDADTWLATSNGWTDED